MTLWVLALLGALAVGRLLWALAAARVREHQRRPVEGFREVPALQRARALAGQTNASFVPGNRVELLVNGDRIFPALLEAICDARDTIDFLTFIYWRGDIARETAATLSDAARRGVEVRLLLDDFGSLKMDRGLVETMRAAGCRVEYFNPLRWYTVGRYSYRTHRKILVVDGAVGFTGRDLLDAGARVFEYQPTMMHAKVVTADDGWSVIGSANFDNRSFELNYESSLVVLDGGLTAALREQFERDLESAAEIDREALAAEAPWKTLLGRFLLLLRNQL